MNGMPLSMLKAACLVTIAAGLVGAAASHPLTAAPWTLLMDVLQWPLDRGQSVASSEARVLSAIGGGLSVGWGVLLYLLAAGPVARGEQDASRMFITSVLAWFTVDSIASLAAGWPGNVALNIVFLAALTAPFLFGGRNPVRAAA
jgi:hypothetical protein